MPTAMRPAYEAVTALTDAVCRDHLDDAYRDLARRMAAALCRKRPSPLASGQARTWACGIVYTLGQINFLTDPGTPPFLTTADLCRAFGVGQSTASAKARAIGQALDTGRMNPDRMNPEWCLRGLIEANPLIWMAEVDGILVDLRDLPRAVREAAFEAGLIPYVPDDGTAG